MATPVKIITSTTRPGRNADRVLPWLADRFEAEDLAFFERVRAGYLARMREAPRRIVRIDSSRDKGEVQRQIDAALLALEARSR